MDVSYRQCPNSRCGNTVSRMATLCPYCSQPLPPASRRESPTVEKPVLLRIGAATEDVADAAAIALSDGVPTMIGRLSEGAIGDALDRPDEAFSGVSRAHVWVTVDGREVVLCDKKSTAGTFVNGQRLVRGQEYRFAMPVIVRLADSCFLRIERSP